MDDFYEIIKMIISKDIWNKLFVPFQGHYNNGTVFPGVVPLLRRLHLDIDSLEEKFRETAMNESQETSLISNQLEYVYSFDIFLSCLLYIHSQN